MNKVQGTWQLWKHRFNVVVNSFHCLRFRRLHWCIHAIHLLHSPSAQLLLGCSCVLTPLVNLRGKSHVVRPSSELKTPDVVWGTSHLFPSFQLWRPQSLKTNFPLQLNWYSLPLQRVNFCRSKCIERWFFYKKSKMLKSHLERLAALHLGVADIQSGGGVLEVILGLRC